MRFCFFSILVLLMGCQNSSKPFKYSPGTILSGNMVLSPDTIIVKSAEIQSQPFLIIEGNNTTIDFQGTYIKTDRPMDQPDLFSGIAISVRAGKNIQIKNLKISGFKTAIHVEGIENFTLKNCDLSYNYRPELAENRHDPSSVKTLVNTESPAVLELKSCKSFLLDAITCSHNFHSIIFEDCEAGKVQGSKIQFNSGNGVRLKNSQSIQFIENEINWNFNGFSYGLLNKPLEYGALKLDTLSIGNIFKRNDLSHSRHFLPMPAPPNISFNSNEFEETDWSHSFSVHPPQKIWVKNDDLDQTEIRQDTNEGIDRFQGPLYMLQHEWGPYDFGAPSIWLRKIEESMWTFLLVGPSGNWKVVDGEGWTAINPKTGTLPATLFAQKISSTQKAWIELEFIGEAGKDLYGLPIRRGQGVKIKFSVPDAKALNQALLDSKFD